MLKGEINAEDEALTSFFSQTHSFALTWPRHGGVLLSLRERIELTLRSLDATASYSPNPTTHSRPRHGGIRLSLRERIEVRANREKYLRYSNGCDMIAVDEGAT